MMWMIESMDKHNDVSDGVVGQMNWIESAKVIWWLSAFMVKEYSTYPSSVI